MTSPTSTPRDTASLYHAAGTQAFPALLAVGISAAAWATLIVVGVAAVFGGLDLTVAIAMGQLAMVAVPVIAARVGRRHAQAIGLARAPWQYAVAALLIGASTWYINVRLVELLQLRSETAALEQLVDESSLGITLLAIALAPAVCEEIVFRGVLLRGLATRFHATFAIALSALVFAAYHMNLVQLFPTFTLGCILGMVALRAASALPTMLAHFINNAIAVVIARGELPMLSNRDATGWLDRHPTLTLTGATALTVSGIAIAMVAPRAPAPRAEGVV